MSLDVFSAKRHDGLTTIEPKRTALIVVDMLNDFCKPGGKMVLPGYEKLVPPQLQVIDAARASGAAIIWLLDTHRANVKQDREFLKRTPHCLENSWGAQVIEDLQARPDDIYVIKRRFSGFFNTDLDLTLKDLGAESVVVFGVVTNICVRSTVHDAFFHGYNVVVPEDCCAATGAREQASSLYDIGTHFGTVSDAASVAAALLQGTPIRNKEAA